MEALIFIGVQASGKSTFYRERFADTHVRINLDMLKTRHRERRFIDTCLETQQRFVVDNTNPTRKDRERYIQAARASGFRVTGYYFQSAIDKALECNRRRPEKTQVPERGIRGTHGKLELPGFDEGFDELYYVCIDDAGGFEVQGWNDEV